MAEVQFSQEENGRRKAPQFNTFRSWVTDELNSRKMEYPMQPATPFVRFTSCQQDNVKNYAYFTLGLHGFHAEDLNIFDISYGTRDIVGYATDLNNKREGRYLKRLISVTDLTEGAIPPAIAEQLSPEARADQRKFAHQIQQNMTLNINNSHPVPGVTGVNVVRRDLGAPMTVEVTYVCYNRAQLEFLRNHFMTAGRFVVVEWGNMTATRRPAKVLDFTDFPNITTELTNALTNGRKYVIDKWVRPNRGNYDFVVGTVGNFNIDFDAKTNIHTCTTTIYSMGELMWGFDLNKTVVRKETDADTSKVSSFADFFQQGSGYDKLIERAVGNSELIAENSEIWDARAKNAALTAAEMKDMSTNPLDYRFISWKFFARNVLYHLFNSIKVEGLRTEMMQFLRFYNDEEFKDDPERETWVCDNPHLRSTNADTMVLIKKTMTGTVPAGFTGAGCFDDFSNGNGWRGKLTKGVWLNTGMIRRCFLENNSFAGAMKAILTAMNNATANFWKLRLFFDEEEQVYKIIDEGCVNSTMDSLPSFYKFNMGGTGETLNLEFDSAFPPELVTQMALYAQMKSSTPPQQKMLMERYPSLGTTSTFMYSLNWTNLTDVLQQSYFKTLPGWSGYDDFADVTVAPKPGETEQAARATVRLTGGVAASGAGGATAISPSGAPVGKKISETAFKLPADTSVVVPRDPTGKAPDRGTIAYRNCNPGNLSYVANSFLTRDYGAVPGDPPRFCRFPSNEIGFAALCKQIERYKERNYTARQTVYVYAPPSENDSELYLSQFCQYLECSPDTRLVALDTVTVARFIAKKESGTSMVNAPPKVTYFEENAPQTNVGSQIFSSSSELEQLAQPAANVPQEPVGLNDELKRQAEELEKHANDIRSRFGNNFINLIELMPSAMVNRITRDGYMNYITSSKSKPNPFVCPFPTTASVTLTIWGISGLSVSDGFYVDRLPFIFEQYGVFQITTINERITPQGWVTTIKGYFRMLFLNGEGLAHSSKTPALAHTPVNV